GFIGLLAILSLFAFLLYRAMRVTMRSRDQFAQLLAIGIVSWIAYQTLINIGGITRTIPLTGVPLPFLSYGGSSLIALMAAVGILLNLSRFTNGTAYLERQRSRPQPRKGSGRNPFLKKEPV
ncbi:MAG: FtsW/RodA/SpoVE family cell cycle protein, partial [Dehalococcoidia bacterium]